jgi:ribosomal protein L11 methylase PrmA
MSDQPERTPHQLVLVWSRSRRSARCRSCDAPITFAQLVATDKWMPFDADPVALKTSQDPATRNLIEHLDAADTHFRSCPNAADHRRRDQ